jgi:hypothetical protein
MSEKQIYDVNFKRLVLLLLPTFLRKSVLTAFLYAAGHHIIRLKTSFDEYRIATNYRLYHNGQTCYLRKVLNDYFDSINRRIEISEVNVNKGLFVVYLRETGKFKIVPRRPDAIITNRRGLTGINNFDFAVKAPVELIEQDSRIRAITNIYKLVSKRFLIDYI